jgi:hypothetical protein
VAHASTISQSTLSKAEEQRYCPAADLTFLVALQGIKGVMVPIFQIEDSMQARSTENFPAPLNMRPLPAMIITEKGEALDEFIVRAEPDFFTSMQVLTTDLCIDCEPCSESGLRVMMAHSCLTCL